MATLNGLVDNTRNLFTNLYSDNPQVFSQAPGRINIIGEHTDYTGGLSLPAAINCWTVCAWQLRQDNKINIYSNNMQEKWQTDWSEIGNVASTTAGWHKYVGGACQLFNDHYLADDHSPGFDLVINGNVPINKGVSSSASLELAILNGLNKLYCKDLAGLILTKLAQQVEHQYLRVQSGLLDQFASQFSQANGALLIDFNSLEYQLVQISPKFTEYTWVLVDTMVARTLSGSKYSERVNEYQRLCAILKTQNKTSLRAITTNDVDMVFQNCEPSLRQRARHVVSENERTINAFHCLNCGRVNELGELLNLSHDSLANDYEVSHPNLNFIVNLAHNLAGVVGGRMMGGGFGGCVLLLIERNSFQKIATCITQEYQKFSQLTTLPSCWDFVNGASAWE